MIDFKRLLQDTPTIKIRDDKRFGYCFQPLYNRILISINKEAFNKLTDKEKDTLISDSLTHEYMHYVLTKEFDKTVSCLYDIIEDKFRDTNILEKYYTNLNIIHNEHYMTHKNACLKYGGYKHIHEYYHLNIEQINQAYKITNCKINNTVRLVKTKIIKGWY